jgi:hypothetical protein
MTVLGVGYGVFGGAKDAIYRYRRYPAGDGHCMPGGEPGPARYGDYMPWFPWG